MTNDQTGRPPRQTTGGSPATSTIMLAVTVVAIVVGFLILRNIRNDDGGSVAPQTPNTQVSNSTTSSVAGAVDVTTTTALVDVKTGTKVQVANSSSGQGVAGKLSKDLQANGFQTGKATNSTGASVAATTVYYDPANTSGQPVAETVARLLGGVTVQPLPAAIPIQGGALDTGVGVLILLGNDKAGKTIAEMSGASATTSSPAVAAVATVATPTTAAAAG